MFSNKTILLVSPEPWDHIFVSKHHYAVHLAKRGNKVFFLNPPTNSETLSRTEFENVFSVNYSGFPNGLRYYPSILQRFFTAREFSKLQTLCEVMFDVIWSFDNSVFFDFSALPSRVLKVSHIVDLNQHFQTRKSASTADFCFCTTELIKERLLKFNPHVYKINHGFNSHSSFAASVRLPGKSPLKAVYSGNLAMPFIDWVLIHLIATENPQVDFVFVGPNMEVLIEDVHQNMAKQSVLTLANSFFIGRVESKELLPYLVSADILLVAYQEEYHADQSNPHKLMEYFGSKKMIVATYSDEYKELALRNLLLMTKYNKDFPYMFKRALAELEFWNSEEKQDARQAFALDNTYDRQIDRIEQILKLK